MGAENQEEVEDLSAKGTGTASASASVVASNPVLREGKRILVTTAKGGPDGSTIKRTISGELAPLQIKSAKVSGETFEIVHLHCLKDKEVSAYKRGSSKKLEDLYEVVTVKRIRCKTCGREWFSDGFICESHGHPQEKEKA